MKTKREIADEIDRLRLVTGSEHGAYTGNQIQSAARAIKTLEWVVSATKPKPSMGFTPKR